MDVFTGGMTPELLWGTQSGADFESEEGIESCDIFATAMQNLFNVGRVIIDYLR